MSLPAGNAAHAPAAPSPATEPATAQRLDGWTPERRATFLEAVAEGHTVEAACRHVGLSVASAYALRRRAGGEAFALGWRAACLLARDRLVDILSSRAIDGQVETYTRADGTEVTRHRYDNRLAMSLLTRLDRLAERPAEPFDYDEYDPQPAPAPDAAEAARLAAAAFPRLLTELIEADADEAETDAFVRAEAGIDTAEPPRSAEDPRPAEDPHRPQLPQLRRFAKGQEWLEEFGADVRAETEGQLFWYDEEDEQWLTFAPPPPGFDGIEYGRSGEPKYARTLTEQEQAEMPDPVDA